MDHTIEPISQVPDQHPNLNDQSGIVLPSISNLFESSHKIDIDPTFDQGRHEDEHAGASKRQKLDDDDTPPPTAPDHAYEDVTTTARQHGDLYALDVNQMQSGGFQPVAAMLGQSTPPSIYHTSAMPDPISLVHLEALAAFSHMPAETLHTFTAEQLSQINNWHHMSGYSMDPQTGAIPGSDQFNNDGGDGPTTNNNEDNNKNDSISNPDGEDVPGAGLAYFDNAGGPVGGKGSIEVVDMIAAGGGSKIGKDTMYPSPPQQQQRVPQEGEGVTDANPLTSTGKKPRAERKKWTDDETKRMLSFVTDVNYRLEQGIQNVAGEMQWNTLSQIFDCSVQTAKRKYRHLMEQEAAIAEGKMPREKGKRQHHAKKLPYRWMIVSALSQLAGYRGTAPAIFERIECNPQFQADLDTRIMPGTKQVPRWKLQVRKVLSADIIFVNTGVKEKHETIWELDSDALQSAQADRQRDRAGIPPIAFPPNYSADAVAQHVHPDFANLTPEQQEQQHLAAAVAYATALGIPLEQAQQMTANLTGAQALEMMNQLYQQAYMQNQMAMGDEGTENAQGAAVGIDGGGNRAQQSGGKRSEPATRAAEENDDDIVPKKEDKHHDEQEEEATQDV